MIYDVIIKKVELFLASSKRWPIIVDFSNKKQIKDFIHHFNVGTNKILSAGEFCGNDETMKFEELFNSIANNNGNVFCINLSGYLKVYGDNILKKQIKSILSKSIDGHVVIVTYQCQNYLKFADSRFIERGQILLCDGDFDEWPSVCFISPSLIGAFSGAYLGFDKLGKAIETSEGGKVYIATSVNKQVFEKPLVSISQRTSSYDILCSKDTRIKNIPESFGEPEQWTNLLKKMGLNDFTYVVDREFGTMEGLIQSIKQYPSFNSEKRWLYYIALLILGIKKNTYVFYVINSVTNYQDIPKALFRKILEIDKEDKNFTKLYEERKDIMKSFNLFLNELADYCKLVSSKQEDAIYYLTDITQLEKEKIIEWLDTYGESYTSSQLVDILKDVYPDLALYLTRYRFKKDFLNEYFDAYKYQKVINKILPSFEAVVEEQAINNDFLSLLPARTSIFDKIDLTGTRTYFFDALGVEYLGFIVSKCNKYNLSVNIFCAHSELPSLTCFNKEFIDTCKTKQCPVIDIKTLDQIKHHGEESCDYEKTKTPLYIIKELEIIDGLLRKIQVEIFDNHYKKAVIVSDHGASRLAVLHETENIWQMETKGVHSGRCCPKNDINTKIDNAIEEANYWVITNYDRFRGGRKANVEVHGGATLEEVAVPIIEITKKIECVEAFILDNYKVITLAAMEIPVLKIYVGLISDNIILKINDKYYEAKATTEKYIYEIKLLDCTKKGIYYADIINGVEEISTSNKFEIKKKGMTEVSLFD